MAKKQRKDHLEIKIFKIVPKSLYATANQKFLILCS